LSEALAGIALGVLTIVAARSIRGQRWFYSIGLLTLPSLYALFALRVGERAVGIQELMYGLPFLAAGLFFAFVSVRASAIIVGGFWILHAVYDLIHDHFITNAGVPDWYPVFCFAVDVVVGGYVLWLATRISNANLRQA
jgi:hypothetical protein